MDNKLLNPWAKDINGNFVSIEHAQKGQEYFCPKCHEPLLYCKKGDGPRAHQDHFKHKADTECKGYTPHESESAIHKFAKEAVYNILREFIEKHRDLPITWNCPECGIDMTANLLKRAMSVEMEQDLTSARPDVSLLDKDSNTIVAIEIVFTHDIESETMRFYDNNNIVVVRIKVHTAEDCNDMFQKLRFPDSVNLCFNENCPRGAKMQVYRRIIPVLNENNQLVGLAVGLDNPFEEEIVKGLPFTEQDKHNAIAVAKEKWPGKSLSFVDLPEYPFPFITPYAQQTPSLQSRMSYRPQRNHPDIDTLMHQRQVKAIRRNYAIRSNRAKKSGGRRRR